MNLKKIILYKEPAISEINTELLTEFLEEKFPIKVEIRNNVFKEFSLEDIKKLSNIRITDIKNPFSEHKSSDNEIEFEKKLCEDSSVMNSTTKVENAQEISEVFMYDGFELQDAADITIYPQYDATGGVDSERTFVKQVVQKFINDGTSEELFDQVDQDAIVS